MRHDSEALFTNAIESLHAARPSAEQLSASASRVADRLRINYVHSLDGAANLATIDNCENVQQLLAAYRAGALPDTRSLLVEAHLRDCSECKRAYSTGPSSTVLDWSSPRRQSAFTWRPRSFGWALTPAFALLITLFFVYRAFWQVPSGVRAEVQSIDGPAYFLSTNGGRQIAAGDPLKEGDQFRTSGGGHAVLRLADGSTVEVNERSVVGVGARGRNATIALESGALIVQAAHRSSGHLYVQTADCRVAVTGTVFSVNAGIKGSRVAVLEGSLHVTHSGVDTLMHAGEQVTTNQNLATEPVEQQIAWSHDRDKYVTLLTQFNVLQHRFDQISSPALRYSSDLLGRMPVSTSLYVSIPNFGDFLGQANSIFHDQMKQSPELQRWWQSGEAKNGEQLDYLVESLQQVSQYLGNEVVIVGVESKIKENNSPAIAVVADLDKSGLDDFLRNQMAVIGNSAPLVILNETTLATANATSPSGAGGYALVRPHEVVITSDLALLKQMDAQLNADASGFAIGDFGQQISSAYQRGAGVILAADVHEMLTRTSNGNGNQKALENSGLNGVHYLIAEHREVKSAPENHLNLQFSGARQGVASWLAAPAPIGSLDFVTPNASMTVALLSKDPAAIADDILNMANQGSGSTDAVLSEAQANLQIDIRNDLAANLGGDFLLSLDGAVLPTPAWKAVIEVHNSDQLEKTIEHLVEKLHQAPRGKQSRTVSIETSEVSGQRFYAIQDDASGSVVAQYTFADGYMIIAPDRALLMQAIHAHTSGESLARSAAFKALLPQDENANYSAVAYQNLGPVLAPLLSHLSGNLAEAVKQMASDSRPTAICAWGKDNRIEAASNSRLFGFDFLTLQALLRSATHPGNNRGDTSVSE